jgi:shikimate dehydrogenase
MIAIEVARHGGRITLAVIPQDLKNAQLLMAEILENCSDASVRITDISQLSGSFDLLINATPVGMYPKVDACAVSDEVIENAGSVFDVIYNPTETLLMKKARAIGKTAVGGAAMLVYQAVKAHEIWYGGSFPAEDVAKIISEVEEAVNAMNK